MALEEMAAEALEIFEAIEEKGHRQATQAVTEEVDCTEATWQAILEGLAEAKWKADHQERARRAFEVLAVMERARETTLALQEELAEGRGQRYPTLPPPAISFLTGTPPHEDASTNTPPIPQSPISSTNYMHLPHLAMPSPNSIYAMPSFIKRFDLSMVITKIELMPEGVVYYGHLTTALPVCSSPLLTDSTITAEKDFHNAIMLLKQYAQIEGALRQIGEPELTADIYRYRMLTLEIEEACHAIDLYEQCWSHLTVNK
ncbi:hypothetical protein EW146_g9935 [Bondarzewia mesenterica]|uniref:Uncharacterized protein n=1 Tax=Bondarzewia mesenterica TaxID=1095465 RepID=A0A4S4L261_9AGAM|nr:hypothetical protein EW146_g9935 [Bondarzewia mesenterica]